MNLVEESRERSSQGLPPAFLDWDGKDVDWRRPEGGAGDYIIWKDIIDAAGDGYGNNVLFVTNDQKVDFWDTLDMQHFASNVEPRQPHFLLSKEFYEETKGVVRFARIDSLVLLAERAGIELREESYDAAASMVAEEFPDFNEDCLHPETPRGLSMLNRAIRDLQNRIGATPMLTDFAHFETEDPVVLATKKKCYWTLLSTFNKALAGPSAEQEAYLSLLNHELLNGKRPHEMLLIQNLLVQQTISRDSFAQLLEDKGCVSDDATLASVERILTLEFFTQREVSNYGPHSVMDIVKGTYRINPNFRRLYDEGGQFAAHVDDAVETAIYLSQHKNTWSGRLKEGIQYTRKDVCRLLNFETNQYGTLYSYKPDTFSNNCPIFITYDKSEEVSVTVQCEDEFDDENTIDWFTRSRRSLNSKIEHDIADNVYTLHVFAKRADVDSNEFYYLGGAEARDARDTHIRDTNGNDVSVVNMKLDLETPVDPGLYGYLTVSSLE